MSDFNEALNISVGLMVLAFILLATILIPLKGTKDSPIETSQEGAKEALSHINEWTKWMAAIQTAALGFLAAGLLGKDYLGDRVLNAAHIVSAAGAFGFLGAALFFNAWTFSSLPSQVLRLYRKTTFQSDHSTSFDVYLAPVYAWQSENSRFNLAYLLVVKHWLWALGLACLGVFAVMLYVQPPSPVKQPCPASSAAMPPARGG